MDEADIPLAMPAELALPPGAKPIPIPSGFVRVASSNLAAIGFFEGNTAPAPDRLTYINAPSSIPARQSQIPQGRLEVLFHNGQLWAYEPVPALHILGLLKAQSIGAYFNEYIKKNSDIKAAKVAM